MDCEEEQIELDKLEIELKPHFSMKKEEWYYLFVKDTFDFGGTLE